MAKERGRRSKDQEKKKERREVEVHEKQAKELTSASKEDIVAEEEKLPQQIATPFFGLVDPQELDYFKNAESTLNVNAFDSSDDKTLFINSVIEEAKGKELKLVTNQICSKLVERLIILGSDSQVKQFYRNFNGHFASLAHHKYASHCLETLFKRSAALIEREILYPPSAEQQEQDEEQFATLENLFLYACAELKPYCKEMIKHQYASHVLRLILIILSGREIPSSTEANSILRSKKSKIARKMIEIKDADIVSETVPRGYKIPSSFFDELGELLKAILKGQDTAKLRESCINSVSSPTYSLILSIEGLVLRERPFWDLCFAPQDTRIDTKEEAFVEYCLSDAVGSHFLQQVFKQARIKSLERVFEHYIASRVLKIAKRKQTGAYVLQVLLTKLKSDNLFNTLNELIANLDQIGENQELVKQIIETSKERKHYKKDEIVKHLFQTYPEAQFLESSLKLSSSTLGNTRDDWPTSQERRDAIFLESLFEYDDAFINAAIQDILQWDTPEKLVQMCKHGVFSHVIEKILTKFQKIDTITRRKFLNSLLGSTEERDATVVALACHSNGSHIMDALWPFTTKLNNYKEIISNALIQNNTTVKNSTYGKLVWKNWHIDAYQRKKFDWKKLVKDQELEYFPPATATDESASKDNKRKPESVNSKTTKRIKI